METTPFEPYVEDPHEPRLPRRGTRLQTLVVVVVVLIIGLALAWLFVDFGEQDPSLDAPVPTAPPDEG